MDEDLMAKLLTAILHGVLLAVVFVPFAIWQWRAAPKQGRERLAKTLAIGGVDFSPAVHGWLEDQFVRRDRWHVYSAVILWTAFDVSTWRPTSPRFMAAVVTVIVIVIVTAISVTHAFRATRDLRRSRTTTRVATLRPRSIRSYLHPLELADSFWHRLSASDQSSQAWPDRTRQTTSRARSSSSACS